MNQQLPDLNTIVETEKKMFGKYLLPIAILLIVIGIFGLLSPMILSAVTDGIIAAILIIAGFTWILHSVQMHQHQLADWLKPLLLLITGGIMIAMPNAGIAAIGLMFILYFIIDAYRNFTQSGVHAHHGRGWFIFSGIVDIAIAILFFVTWPQGSLILVGIFVGVNLIFDGIILLMLRNASPGQGTLT
ncbi:MAG: HdeD family acid-resistance protein [Acidithiobacillus sp.]